MLSRLNVVFIMLTQKNVPLNLFLPFYFNFPSPKEERRVLRLWPQGGETFVGYLLGLFSRRGSASPGSDLTPFVLFWLIVDFVCCAVFNNHLFCFFIQIYFFMPLIFLYSVRGQRSLAFLVRQRRLTLSFMPYCYVDMSIVALTCVRAWALSSPDALFFTDTRQCTLGILELDFAATFVWFLLGFCVCFLAWLKQAD